MNMDDIVVYYDKQCPFCKRYGSYLKIKKVHNICLRNAREYSKKMKDYCKMGYDINKGIIILHKDKIYHGSEAILYIQYLITGNNIYRFNIVKSIGPTVYYFINKIRQGILWIKNIGNIL